VVRTILIPLVFLAVLVGLGSGTALADARLRMAIVTQADVGEGWANVRGETLVPWTQKGLSSAYWCGRNFPGDAKGSDSLLNTVVKSGEGTYVTFAMISYREDQITTAWTAIESLFDQCTTYTTDPIGCIGIPEADRWQMRPIDFEPLGEASVAFHTSGSGGCFPIKEFDIILLQRANIISMVVAQARTPEPELTRDMARLADQKLLSALR